MDTCSDSCTPVYCIPTYWSTQHLWVELRCSNTLFCKRITENLNSIIERDEYYFGKIVEEYVYCISNAIRSNKLNSLNNPPQLSQALSRNLWKLRVVNLLQSSDHINFSWVPCPLIIPCPQSVTCIHRQEDRDTNVSSQEICGGPVLWEEHCKPVDEAQKCERHERQPRPVWLDKVRPGARDSVMCTGLLKAEVDYHATHPTYHAPCVGQVDEPVEHHTTSAAHIEVGQDREKGRDADGVDWNTGLGAFLEDVWCVAADRKTVQGSTTHVKEGVAGRPCRYQDDGIDDTGKGIDARIRDSDNKGTRARTCMTIGETWVV